MSMMMHAGNSPPLASYQSRQLHPKTLPLNPKPLPPQVIDLGDDMSFSALPGGSSVDALQCSDPTIPSDASNLVIKVRRGGGVLPPSWAEPGRAWFAAAAAASWFSEEVLRGLRN